MIQAEHKWDDDELDLFRAGRGEAPAAASAGGVFAALGLDGPIGPDGGAGLEQPPVSQVAPISSPEVTAAQGPKPAPPSGIFARPLPWIGAGGVLLALIPAALLLSRGQSEATSSDQPSQQQATDATDSNKSGRDAGEDSKTRAATEGDGAADDALAVELSDLEEAEPQSGARAEARKTSPSASDAARPSLAEELKIIKDARQKLNAGDLAGAEATLSVHQKKFQPPRLSSEALVLRVEILIKRGKMAEARALAAPLMKENSPYRARMETLLSK